MLTSDDKVGGSKKVKIMMTWYLNGPLQRGFQDTIMIHENDIGRVDLSPDYLTLCNRYFIRETSLQTAILDEKSFGVASYFFFIKFGLSEKDTKIWTNLPHALDIYLVNVQSTRKIFSNFLCFSWSPNFNPFTHLLFSL